MKKLMKKLLNLILVGFCLLIAPMAYAEEPSIFEAGMKITVGMPKATIMSNLKNAYKLVKTPKWGDDHWSVHELDTNESILQIGFDNDVLVWASHDWKVHGEQSSAYSLGNSLFSLLSNITKDTRGVAFIKTETKRGADITLEELEIEFPQRRVSMIIIRIDKQRTVQVTESIFQ